MNVKIGFNLLNFDLIETEEKTNSIPNELPPKNAIISKLFHLYVSRQIAWNWTESPQNAGQIHFYNHFEV